MEEETLYDRIGEADLNPTYKDGQVYQHTDINNMLSILKTAVNENYYDIQKLENGTKVVEKSNSLDGATLSRYLDETLQADDNKIPSSQQAKAYMDDLFAEYSPPIRGVDYWTTEDKEEIIDESVDAIKDVIESDYYDKSYIDTALSGKISVADIVDNLDSNETAKPLSAKQGKELNKIKVTMYNTVADMKADTSLKTGMTVKTLGYYEVNDGGSGEYIIVSESSETDHQEGLNNGLFVSLIENKKDVINVLQWGAKSDGLTDNSSIFNNIIDYANSTLKNIYIPSGKYLIENDLHDINGCVSVYGDISGEGQRENKATIIDNRTSSNYLFNFISVNIEGAIKGGSVSYLNFVDNKINENKCIKTNDAINYLGNINNCNFLDYMIGLEVNGSHGFILNTCGFIRCGDKVANSDNFAIIIKDTTDVSINNCCIDHTRYELFVDGSSMVYVTNTHFEVSKKDIVKGKEPIYCQMGNYGYISFTNCSFINLSYKEWIESAEYTTSNVIGMIYASYGSFVNCMFSCGRGSGSYLSEYNKQAKFLRLYYGSIDNSKIKLPSYNVPSFELTQSSINNSHIQCDIEETDFSLGKNKYIINSDNNNFYNNYLQYIIPTLDPQTYPTNYPLFSKIFTEKPVHIETNKANIFYTNRIPYAKINNINTIRLQSNDMLFGAYHIKIYSIGETKLFYDGYIRINTDKSIAEISYNQKSFGSSNKIVLYSDDDSNDVYIQIEEPQYKTNTIVIEIENLEGHTNLLMYVDNNIQSILTYANKLDLSV